MDFFLDRRLQNMLRDKLAEVPSLVEELSVTITRRDHIRKAGLGSPRRSRPESQVPFNIDASEAADELHNALATWVRHVCEERHIIYTDSGDILTLARWLRRNMVALALTEGSPEAYGDLVDKIDACRSRIDLPPDDRVVIDGTRVAAANRSVVTLDTVGGVAARLGPMGKGLNRDRLRLLAKRGDVRPYGAPDPDTGTRFYRLGDVLHAHNGRAVRRSKTRRNDA